MIGTVLSYYNPKTGKRDFPGIPVVKGLPSDTGDISSIPSLGTKIPHVTEQPKLHCN